MSSPPRRQSSRRVATSRSYKEPGSEDDFATEPLKLLKKGPVSRALATRRAADKDDESYESSGSDTLIPAEAPKTPTNRAKETPPPGKRDASREPAESPTTKKRRIIFTTKKEKSSDESSVTSPAAVSPRAAASSNRATSKETTPATSTAPSQPAVIQDEESSSPTAALATLPPAVSTDEVVNFQQELSDFLDYVRDSTDAARRSVQGVLDTRAMQARIDSLEAQLEAARGTQSAGGDLAKCERDLAASRAREKELEASFERLQVQLQKQVAENNGLRHEMVNMTDEHDRQSDFPYEKITDDQIGRDWRRLAHEIQNFTLQFLTRVPNRVSAPRGANALQVNALRTNQKQNPKLAYYYLQNYIWDRINDEVFHAGSNVWGGRSGQAFNRFCVDVAEGKIEEMEKFSPMKAQMAGILRSTHDATNKAEVAKLINGLRLDLHIFTDPDKVKDVESRLRDIVCRAIRLNFIFVMSRAFFRPMDVENEYDEDDVDIKFTRGNPDGDTEIELQISPQITKIGDADGYEFGSSSIVCKAMVTMCEVEGN